MKRRFVALAGVLALALAADAAAAKTFRYAFQGDLNALDPYTLNETFTLGRHGQRHGGPHQARQGPEDHPGPGRERWEIVDPLKWRFYLRKGVKFHNGEDFTADDVVFSLDRMRSPGSQIKTRAPADMKAVKVDDHTVDFVLASPNPILHAEWDTWYIFSKKWSEANGAVNAQPATATSLSPFAVKANGTGPFVLVSHEPGVKTVFKPNPNWWGKVEHNLTEVVFQTIKSDATRVAALLSGDIDMMDPVPVQDVERVKSSPNTRVLTGPELRTIFLHMDSFRDELLYSNVKGKNPFKDARVRRAVYQAIDMDAIHTKIMRGLSANSAILISPLLFARAGEFKRWPYDVAAAKKLLADAGYPERLRGGDGLPQRSLRQRRGDLPGRDADAGAHRHQGEAQLHAEVEVLREGRRRPEVQLLLQPARLDAGIVRQLERDRQHHRLPRRRREGRGLFNYGGYCNPQDRRAQQGRSWSRPTSPSATP